ncbi:MAG: hypothetical protein ACI4A2_06475 [Candidatus Cryptobacteroides sp.]
MELLVDALFDEFDLVVGNSLQTAALFHQFFREKSLKLTESFTGAVVDKIRSLIDKFGCFGGAYCCRKENGRYDHA